MRFEVEGMTCGHCVGAVKGAILRAIPGATVDVDLSEGLVAVGETGAEGPEQVNAAIENAGYTVERQVA